MSLGLYKVRYELEPEMKTITLDEKHDKQITEFWQSISFFHKAWAVLFVVAMVPFLCLGTVVIVAVRILTAIMKCILAITLEVWCGIMMVIAQIAFGTKGCRIVKRIVAERLMNE